MPRHPFDGSHRAIMRTTDDMQKSTTGVQVPQGDMAIRRRGSEDRMSIYREVSVERTSYAAKQRTTPEAESAYGTILHGHPEQSFVHPNVVHGNLSARETNANHVYSG